MTKARSIKRLLRDTRGDTGFVEWLLLVGLVAIAGYAAFQTVGKNITTKANAGADTVNGIPMAPGGP